MTPLKAILLLSYYIVGTITVFVAAYMMWGFWSLMFSIGLWLLVSAILEKDMR